MAYYIYKSLTLTDFLSHAHTNHFLQFLSEMVLKSLNPYALNSKPPTFSYKVIAEIFSRGL